MDKQQARKIITETFENPFDKGRFTGFIKNLLNRMDEGSFVYKGNYIPDAYKQYIKTLERIGKFSDGDNSLDIVVITLQKETSLERARTMQRNFIAWYLNGSRGGNLKDAALVAYVSPDQADWRFSLVKMDYRFDLPAPQADASRQPGKTKTGKVKVKEEFTPARRWSFLVGTNEKSHTAQSRLVNILANDEQAPTLAELENAFDIETVTKEFFLKYRDLFLRTKEALDKVVRNDPKIKADFEAKGVDTVNFAKKLLGQVVFLYFLQKKGWFGVGRDDDWGTGSKRFLRSLFKKKHGGFTNFFNDILEPLFYEALRIDRSYDDDYYSRFNCKIPFLNGGLFDPIGNYDWVHTDINLPNDLFSNSRKTKEGDIGDGILDVFDRYNFTVREDEPLEKEVAIDPELLGKAYEKFNAIRPDNFDEFTKALKSGKKGEENKFNKKFGVYYTPREIVHYMCKQSLINYLATRAEEAKLKTSISKQDIEDLIEVGELITEHEATALIKQEKIKNGIQKSTEYTALLSDSIRKNATTIDQWLEEITVCDPAVGSGAFPVGMMNEILRARNVLSVFLKEDGLSDYEFKRRCIEHSLYGVDIDPGAVEIAKLRLWLSLVVEEEDIRNIKPLPNLDYRIMQGNSLISEFMGINFDADENKNRKERISALETEEKEINIKIKEKEKEQVQFYNMHHKQDAALSNALNELTKNNEKIRNEIKKTEKEIEKEKEAQESTELSELLKIFQQKKDEFLNESNVSRKATLKEQVDNLLIEIFESKLKKEKADFFNRLENIRNKYSVLPNEKQRNDIIKQEEEKLYKESGFDLEAAEKQLKEFTSGRQIKPFFLWNLYFSEAFHAKGGFDVVIANPPYVSAPTMVSSYRELRQMITDSKKYKSLYQKWDLYIPFMELGLQLLTTNGVFSMIVPYPLTNQNYGLKLRELITHAYCLKEIVDLSGTKVFENATVSNCIPFITKSNPQNSCYVSNVNEYGKIEKVFIQKNNDLVQDKNTLVWNLTSEKRGTTRHSTFNVLGDYCYISVGMVLNADEKNNKGAFVKEDLISITKDEIHCKKYIEGKDLVRFGVKRVRYLEYYTKRCPDQLRRSTFQELYETDKLLINSLGEIKASLDSGQHYYCEQQVRMALLWRDLKNIKNKSISSSIKKFSTLSRSEMETLSETVDLQYLLGILNSKYATILLNNIRGGDYHIVPEHIRNIPIPNISEGKQKPIITLVDQIIAITKDDDYLQNPQKQARVKELEREIDQRVYQLYSLTEEEIRIVEGEGK